MKKVIFKLTRVATKGNTIISGIGYANDKDLITAQVSKDGKPYVKIYENALANCESVSSETTNAYFGAFIEKYADADGVNKRSDYLVWYRILED